MNRARVDRRYATQLMLKGIALLFCLAMALSGRHPPAEAQERQVLPLPSLEDGLQDDRIKELNEHLAATDAKVQKQWDANQDNHNSITVLETKLSVWGSGLGLLLTAGIVIQVRVKKAV